MVGAGYRGRGSEDSGGSAGGDLQAGLPDHAARQQATGRFGVGLAIAERAVKLHGGRLEALNQAEGGTILSMSLSCEVRSSVESAVEQPADV